MGLFGRLRAVTQRAQQQQELELGTLKKECPFCVSPYKIVLPIVQEI
jgi:hypothetical protein